ncbi:MAG: glycoside hydrolase family 97 protein [Gemmatimonadetes bacterium]|nr:glycoside hydrolase family 97 protein [Gemmatimonadota bacterium]
MRRVLSRVIIAGLFAAVASADGQGGRGQPLTVSSPSGALTVTIGLGEQLSWSVALRGQVVVEPSRLALTLSTGEVLGARPTVKSTRTRAVDEILRPVVRVKRAEVRDRFNERRIDFRGDYALVVRAYDDGVAYRWATARSGELTIAAEEATLRFTDDHLVYFPEETSFQSHQERQYKQVKISEIGTRFSGLPAMVVLPGGMKAVLTEADLFDYPGMDLTGSADGRTLRGLFPAYPKAVQLRRDRDELVTERETFIARTRGTREFPWRVLVLAERDETLLETDIVYRLASESKLTDTSWIRPGLVAWDWWNANNVYGVPFRAGVNTETYKHYIDFAAEHGIPYIILDEGWYPLGDLLKTVPAIDMPVIAAHAKAKNVGLVMWVIWKTLDLQMQPALDQFAAWGVKGIKVDFMQREDQWMVNFYERVAQEAAKRRLLVDFHGSYKPTGLYRTYPHVVTSEGVLGLEQSKWSDLASPGNAVTFPFMRMLAGPVDYTPGAMINSTKTDFKPVFNRPGSQGTRCHQLAMYVVYESPLQMLADSPSNYRKEPESLAFLAKVPTVWDETRVLQAKVGEVIVTARRSGSTWYVGGLTNWSAREVPLDLSFLGAGSFSLELFRDGPNADRAGVDYVREVRDISAADRLTLHLASGGGFAARITPR